MKTGRPAKRERTPFGQRLHTLREQAGLSQQQLADRLGLTQRAYAHWERIRSHSALTSYLAWLKHSMFQWKIWWVLTELRDEGQVQPAR